MKLEVMLSKDAVTLRDANSQLTLVFPRQCPHDVEICPQCAKVSCPQPFQLSDISSLICAYAQASAEISKLTESEVSSEEEESEWPIITDTTIH